MSIIIWNDANIEPACSGLIELKIYYNYYMHIKGSGFHGERVNSVDLGFEKEIFKAADKLRGNIVLQNIKTLYLVLNNSYL